MPLQELDFAGISKIIEEVGVPQIVGAPLDASTGTATMLTVPPGHCFIITKVVGQGDTQAALFDGSPNLSTADSNGIILASPADGAEYNLLFRAFRRWQTPFEQAATPTWRNTPPCSYVHWTPKWPICVPPGWSIQSAGTLDLANGLCAYGYLIGQEHARTLGFDTNASPTDATRRYGAASGISTGSAVSLVTGRPGKHLQILDMFLRVQPEVPEVTNVFTIQQTDDRPIFKFANNNPSNFLEIVCSPGIFLAEGEGIEILSTIALSGTVCLTYRFVDPEDVPGDHWWACTLPQLATPAVTKVGTASNVTTVSTPVECFYPRRETTKTLPTQGFQHILRGYTFSVQKDTTVLGDISFFRLSTGQGSVIGYVATLGVTDTGVPISPVFAVNQQNQAIWGEVDGINVVCPKDTGGISIDMISIGVLVVTTPVATDVDIDEFWVTTWGRTVPARFHGQINRGAAS